MAVDQLEIGHYWGEPMSAQLNTLQRRTKKYGSYPSLNMFFKLFSLQIITLYDSYINIAEEWLLRFA